MIPNNVKIIIIVILLVADVGWSIYLLACTQIMKLLIPLHARGNIHRCHLFNAKHKSRVWKALKTTLLAHT